MADVRKAKLIDDGGEMPAAAKPRKAWPRVSVMVAAAGLACGVLGFAAGFGGGFAVGHVTKPLTTQTRAAKTYTREAFADLAEGKTPDEIIAAVGKPDYTNDTGMWTYLLTTYDHREANG